MLICTREVWNSFKLSQLMFCNGGGEELFIISNKINWLHILNADMHTGSME